MSDNSSISYDLGTIKPNEIREFELYIYIDDSKNGLGSHKDRHENIGYGTIGFDNLINVAYLDKLKNVPKILETPYILDNPPYKFEIEMIKERTFNKNLTDDVLKFYQNKGCNK